MKKLKIICIVSVILNIFLFGVISSPIFKSATRPFKKQTHVDLIQKVSPESRPEISSLMHSLRKQKKTHRSIQKKFHQNLISLFSQSKVSQEEVRALFHAHTQTQNIPQKMIEEQFVKIADLPFKDREVVVEILSNHPKRRHSSRRRK